jgi:glycosyltransferase involved in cell wall biosynthesis
MSYRPNEEGVLWFCKKVAPLIQEKVKVNFHISIVGFSPTKEVRNLAVASNITITGGVDSVIPYYQKADLVIAPIRYGGGTRIKIIEAMSQRLAIVSTTIGAEGLIIKHGENILIADTPEQFAEACSLLIKDSVFRNKIAMGGLECFEKKYSSLTVSKLWQEILQP